MTIQWRMLVVSLLINSYIFGMEDANGTIPDKVILKDCAACEQIDTCKGQCVCCEECQEVYYCSSACKQANRDSHQKDCHKLKQAHCGALASIDFVMQTNLDQLKKTNKKKYLKEVLKWHSRNAIRFAQDCYCCVPEKRPEITKIHKRHLDDLHHLLEQGIIQKTMPEEAFNQMFDSLAWAQKITDNESLVDPKGILSYLASQESHDDFFIPKNQWKSQRLKALQETKDEMEKYSNHVKNGGYLAPYRPEDYDVS